MNLKSEKSSDLRRLQNLYAAIIECDRAIIRSANQGELFDQICRNVVTLGELRFAWIGMVDDGSSRIWPQSHFGEGWNYFEFMQLTAEVQSIQGHGPTDVAILENRPFWANNVATDPMMADWSKLTRTQGWKSAAVIPLSLRGKSIGAISIYAGSVNAFKEKERTLLLQLASNISYALDVFELDSQRKKAEFALQESEVRYNALFASNCMPMLVIEPASGRIVDANIKAVAFYGWDYEVLTTMHVADINVLKSNEIKGAMALAAANQKTYFDFQHHTAGGEIRDVEVFSGPLSLNGQTYLISAIHDITERHKLEVRVRNAQSLMQRFIDQLPGTAFVKDSQLRLLMTNQYLGNILGTSPESLIGKTAYDIFPKEFADTVTALDREMLQHGGVRTYEETFNDRHNETSMFVIDDGFGSKLLCGLSFDVTSRYRFNERSIALLQINGLSNQLTEKEFLTAGLEIAQTLTRSKVGFLHFVNEDQNTLELVTWTASTLQGCMAAFDTHYPLNKAGIWADCVAAKGAVTFNDYPAYAKKKGLPDGHVAMQRIATVPVVEGGKTRLIMGVGNKERDYDDFDVESLLLVANDLWRIARRARVEKTLVQRVDELVVVNRKLSEAQLQLVQSEKMASIGQLASGVAHEINNPIGFVKSNLGSLETYIANLLEIVDAYEAVETQFSPSHADAFAAVRKRKSELDYAFLAKDLVQLIEESREGVSRVSKIVMDLKNFSRSSDDTKVWCDLHTGIDSTINVVWNQLKYKVEIKREYGELPQVRCVASQINQVVMNLLVNAEQAINVKGHITIRTGVDHDDVWFEVEDDGCGISQEDLGRIFEPFFTSKPVGQGTGLGLSISFGIVQRHHGKITVQSTPGVGTTFRVSLPIDSKEELAS